jgi:hypothetical protein
VLRSFDPGIEWLSQRIISGSLHRTATVAARQRSPAALVESPSLSASTPTTREETMAINMIKQDDSLDTIWSVLTYEESRMLNDKDASDLAPAIVLLVDR